jgi:micrococcal nuclease
MSHGAPGGAKGLGIIGIIILILATITQVGRDVVGIERFVTAFNVSPETSASTTYTTPTYYTVVKVVDGDTLTVLIDGKNEKVRLLGINTPETVDPRRPVQCFGKEASAKMKSLVGGGVVRLEYDDSQGLHDSYGRILAYVYKEDGTMVNRQMIAEGYAYEYTYMKPYAYQKEFRELQTLARTSKRGLWADDTCAGSKTLE